MNEADYLRKQAERCRWMAARIDSKDVAATLTGMAEEYEARAAALEGGSEASPPAEPV